MLARVRRFVPLDDAQIGEIIERYQQARYQPALVFGDASFDIIVSTFSMHHWSDPAAGLREIQRVLRPGGRALIWDLRAGLPLFHAGMADPAEQLRAGPLRMVDARPWRWPWRIALSQRIELARS